MFSKPVSGSKQVKKPRSRPWSIRNRLILLYTISGTFVLVMTLFVMYHFLQNRLEEEENQFISDTLMLVVNTLHRYNTVTHRVIGEIDNERSSFHYNRFYLRILATDGTLLYQSPGLMDPMPASNQFPRPKTVEDPQRQSKHYLTPHKRLYVLTSTQALLKKGAHEPIVIHIMLDVTRNHEMLTQLEETLLLVFLAGFLLSVLYAIWVTNIGIRPIEKITEAVHTIHPSSLSWRLHSDNWPEELQGLVEAFDTMLDRLEKSFSQLSQFSADIAHELRTPITNMSLEIELLLSKPRPLEDYQATLSSSLEEFARISRMIDSLLFLARAENPDMKIERVPFNVAEEVRRLVEVFEPVSLDTQIALNLVNKLPTDMRLQADIALFQRALSNLLSNAFKYTPSPGSIWVLLSFTEGTLSDCTARLNIEVQDTGLGIPEEHLPFITQRFYRVDASRSQQHYPGVGLGLSIVKSIMDLHEGELLITSAVGMGTKVTLRFPV